MRVTVVPAKGLLLIAVIAFDSDSFRAIGVLRMVDSPDPCQRLQGKRPGLVITGSVPHQPAVLVHAVEQMSDLMCDGCPAGAPERIAELTPEIRDDLREDRRPLAI